MGKKDPKGYSRPKESWVQTNTEFHRDWNAQENRGEHARWRPGLSVEAGEEHARRYKATGARRRSWFFWPAVLGVLAGAAIIALDMTGTVDFEACVKAIVKSIGALLR